MPGSRDRLLTATTELMRRGGYHRTSVKDIATAADVPNGSLYHHFPGGKSELAAAALRSAGQAYQDLFELAARECDGPGEAVTALFDGAATTLEETGYLDVCPIGTVAGEVASTEEELRRACDDVFRAWITTFATRLTAVGVEATIADERAAAVVATLEGGFTLARTRRDGDVLRAAGRLARQVVEADVEAPAPG